MHFTTFKWNLYTYHIYTIPSQAPQIGTFVLMTFSRMDPRTFSLLNIHTTWSIDPKTSAPTEEWKWNFCLYRKLWHTTDRPTERRSHREVTFPKKFICNNIFSRIFHKSWVASVLLFIKRTLMYPRHTRSELTDLTTTCVLSSLVFLRWMKPLPRSSYLPSTTASSFRVFHNLFRTPSSTID